MGDIAGLAASIKSVGVLQPIIVTKAKDGTGYDLQAGERRTVAAREAGLDTIPAVVIDDKADLETILNALVENIQRADLTPMERAAGYQAALDLGLSVGALSKRTGDSPKDVKRHLAALTSGETSQARLQARTLTLDEALALIPLEPHPALYERVLKSAGTPNFRYDVERATRDANFWTAQATLKAECEAKGVRYLDPNATGNTGRRLEYMDAKVKKGHEALACHALSVSYDGEVVAYCTDSRVHQTGAKPTTATATPNEDEAAKAARRHVIEANKAGDAANTVRRAWIAEFLTRKRLDRAAVVYAAGILARSGLESTERNDAVRRVAGLPDGTSYQLTGEQIVAATGDPDKAVRFLVAAAIATGEKGVEKDFWRHQGEPFAEHLCGLVAFGYEPCEPEVAFLKAHPVKAAGK
jgi:ParB family chromosome partitioning protein